MDATGQAVKVENGTIGLPNVIFSHDMGEGFPLLTTKKMPLRIIAVELEGFIKGITDKDWYRSRGCRIWDEWSNIEAAKKLYEEWYPDGPPDVVDYYFEGKPSFESVKKAVQAAATDLGPIYGYQWRRFGQQYNDVIEDGRADGVPVSVATDQFKYIADTLRSNPYDRRMVCSAWNPNQKHMMALPPCHYAFNAVVYGNELSLNWVQRSCDLMLGVPFNIASYALLLKLLARHANLRVGNLTGLLADCHIYDNQIDGAKQQLEREPRPLPRLFIPNNDGDSFDIFKWDHTQLELVDYDPHGKIDFGAVTV